MDPKGTNRKPSDEDTEAHVKFSDRDLKEDVEPVEDSAEAEPTKPVDTEGHAVRRSGVTGDDELQPDGAFRRN